MNSTTGLSTQETNHTTIAGTAFDLTEKSLVVPPEKQVYVEIPSNIGNGSIEIPVGNAKVYENGDVELSNGKIIKLVDKNAYKNIAKRQLEKAQMNAKAEQKEAENSKENKETTIVIDSRAVEALTKTYEASR